MNAEQICIEAQSLIVTNPDVAARRFHEARTLEPALAQAWLGEGLALSRLGKFAAAIDAFQKAVSVVSTGEVGRQALSMLAMHCELLGRKQEALSAAQKLLEASPKQREVILQVAVLADAVGDADIALDARQKLAALSPKSAAAQADLGLALARRKRFTEAREAFQRVEMLDAGFFARNPVEREQYENLGTRS